MLIYSVVQHTQACDADGWDHWIHRVICSYHLSEQGANDKMIELLQEQVECVERSREINPHLDDEYFNAMARKVMRNITKLIEGTNWRNAENHPMFTIEPITVNP